MEDDTIFAYVIAILAIIASPFITYITSNRVLKFKKAATLDLEWVQEFKDKLSKMIFLSDLIAFESMVKAKAKKENNIEREKYYSKKLESRIEEYLKLTTDINILLAEKGNKHKNLVVLLQEFYSFVWEFDYLDEDKASKFRAYSDKLTKLCGEIINSEKQEIKKSK